MSMTTPNNRRQFAIVLDVLAFAFFLRVLGQALVAFFHVDFLPAMKQWYSGLLPYPLLLPSQILILAVQVKISLDLHRDAGYFAAPRPRAGTVLRYLSFLYAAGNVLRYLLTMSAHPQGSIPIYFHFVLAAYLYVLARYFSREIHDRA